MHHEVVQQLCRPQINDLAERPSYGLLKEVDGAGKPFSRKHGERVPGGQVRSNSHAAEILRRDRPGRSMLDNMGGARCSPPGTVRRRETLASFVDELTRWLSGCMQRVQLAFACDVDWYCMPCYAGYPHLRCRG